MMYGGVIVMVGLRVEVSLPALEVLASGSIWLSSGWEALGGVLPGVLPGMLQGAEGLARSFASGALSGAGSGEGFTV